jgi:hypothetical protein
MSKMSEASSRRLYFSFSPAGQLVASGMEGLAQALEEQRRQANVLKLDFEERLALLVLNG